MAHLLAINYDADEDAMKLDSLKNNRDLQELYRLFMHFMGNINKREKGDSLIIIYD